jgi:hypothetical protein
VTGIKVAKQRSRLNKQARVQILAILLLCISCAQAASPARHRVTIPIPECAVWGVAALSDDRHVAVNCGGPNQGIVVVDVQERVIVTTLPTYTSYTMESGFAAALDGGIYWYGSLPATPNAFGLQRSHLVSNHLETELIAVGEFLEDRGAWTLPNFVAISPRFGCAVWNGDGGGYFAFDRTTGELTASVFKERPSDLTVAESCARNDSGEMVPLIRIVGRAVNFEDNPLVDSYYFGEFDPAQSPSVVRIARQGQLGGLSAIALSDHVFALFLNNRIEWPESGDRRSGGMDFDGRTCGLHAVVVVDTSAKSARCLAAFNHRVAPIGFGPNLHFWGDGDVYSLNSQSLSATRTQMRVERAPLGAVSPSGRVLAWVWQRGELHVIRN